jgi:hypothetical protein
MGIRLICRLAALAVVVLAVLDPPTSAAAAVRDTAVAASGGRSDMLFVAGAGALMLAAVGTLAAVQSRSRDPRPGPDAASQQDPSPDV